MTCGTVSTPAAWRCLIRPWTHAACVASVAGGKFLSTKSASEPRRTANTRDPLKPDPPSLEIVTGSLPSHGVKSGKSCVIAITVVAVGVGCYLAYLESIVRGRPPRRGSWLMT